MIEIVLLKYVNASPVKNNTNVDVKIEENTSGNIKKIDSKPDKSLEKDKENGKKEELEVIVQKKKVINKSKSNFDIDIRINNTFVDCSKEKKKEVSSSWIEFMNFLMGKDRNLISLVADTEILAASDRYILIQSKIDSTNNLINDNVSDLEKYYSEFFGNEVKFAALDANLWKKETEKYRMNKKNKVEYKYIEEKDSPKEETQQNVEKSNDIEDLAADIFGTFEIE